MNKQEIAQTVHLWKSGHLTADQAMERIAAAMQQRKENKQVKTEHDVTGFVEMAQAIVNSRSK